MVAACRASQEDHAGRALAGLPEPTVNHTLYRRNGSVRRRFDLSWPHLRLIVELDGRQHADDPTQHDEDLERREELDGEGWRIIVVTAIGVYKEPDRTLARVRRALVQRGEVPPRLRNTWRKHFPGRPAAS